MEQREFLDFMHVLERLKCNTRHSWTSTGRHETVAAHSWRLGVMALLLREQNKRKRREDRRRRDEAEEARRFQLRRQKKKEKHRGR